jgi:hypothetical protein
MNESLVMNKQFYTERLDVRRGVAKSFAYFPSMAEVLRDLAEALRVGDGLRVRAPSSASTEDLATLRRLGAEHIGF